ncbi:MAG: phospholipase D-like domain-containing protein [Paracoccaceae bacterium]
MNWLLAHFGVVLVTLLALVTAVVILQQRRAPQSTAAWLLFIILVPYIAIPLFLALGFRKRGRRFQPIAFRETVYPRPETAPSGVAALFATYGIPPATDGNRVQLLATDHEAYSALMDLCRSAKTQLDVLFYIVARDEVGIAFVNALTDRARDGVRVRLLMDRFGNLKPPRVALRALTEAGGEVLYFSPLLQRPDSGHLNLRNHRKMVIADGVQVFAGGMNVGTEYMGTTHRADRWTDLAYLLQGPATSTFADIFRSNWAVAGGEAALSGPPASQPKAGTAVAQLVPSGPDTAGDPLHDALVNAIHTASRRVWITTPYFLPTEFLGKALTTAAKRGVDVRILLPLKSNQSLADFARGAYLREMQDAGCQVLLFQNGMIHAKTGIIDDLGYVGSANFDVRSMLLNFETALFLYDVASVAALEAWYLAQERHSTSGLPKAGHLRSVAEGVFRLGSPML